MPIIIPLIIGYVFYVSSILVHILVMKKRISYKLINGGRSTSFEAQYKTSLMSIVILVIGLIVMMMYQLFPTLHQTVFGMILMGMLTLYWTLGFVMQLLGTWLEKRIISIIVLLGVVSHLLLFLGYFL